MYEISALIASPQNPPLSRLPHTHTIDQMNFHFAQIQKIEKKRKKY